MDRGKFQASAIKRLETVSSNATSIMGLRRHSTIASWEYRDLHHPYTSLLVVKILHARRSKPRRPEATTPAKCPVCQEPAVRSSTRGKGMRKEARHIKGGIEPQESPWKFSSIYPQNQSLPTFCFVLSPTPLTLRGAVPHYLSMKKEITYSSS